MFAPTVAQLLGLRIVRPNLAVRPPLAEPPRAGKPEADEEARKRTQPPKHRARR